MSLPVIFSRQARQDLAELQDYLAGRFSSENARAYVRRVTAACKAIGLAPNRGTKSEDTESGVRCVGFEHRISILFVVKTTRVVIICVDYGGRTPRMDEME